MNESTPRLRQNVTIACSYVEAIARGDVAGLMAVLDDRAVLELMGSGTMASRMGKEAIRTLQHTFVTEICPRGIRMDIVSTTAQDDRVSMEVRGHAVTTAGASYNNRYHYLFIIRDAKIRSVREYCDTKLVEQVFGSLESS